MEPHATDSVLQILVEACARCEEGTWTPAQVSGAINGIARLKIADERILAVLAAAALRCVCACSVCVCVCVCVDVYETIHGIASLWIGDYRVLAAVARRYVCMYEWLGAMLVCVCVCVCNMYVCVYIYIYICMCVYIYI